MARFLLLGCGLSAVVSAQCPAELPKCEMIGQTCGDYSCCSGMQTNCGAGSVCAGEESRCGARSICSGISSEQLVPSKQMEPMQPMKPMAPMKPMEPIKPMEPMAPMQPMKPMEPMEPMQPMKPMAPLKPMEPMKFQPFRPSAQNPPTEVHNHGCIIGSSCAGHAASSIDGLEICCPAGCPQCSVSASSLNGVLSATCVCGDDSLLMAKGNAASPIDNEGCDVGDTCNSRGSSMVNGQKFCCPSGCPDDCSLSVSQSKVISASCQCPVDAVKGWTATEKCAAFAGLVLLLGAGAYAFHKQQSPELSKKLLQ